MEPQAEIVRGAKVWADFEDLAIITSHDIETVAGFRHFCIQRQNMLHLRAHTFAPLT
jgi:hypothetical protein